MTQEVMTGELVTADLADLSPAISLNGHGAYPARTKSKVCIVGFAESSRADAPWDDPDMEFWGINRLHVQLPEVAWDRYFQIHDFGDVGKDEEHLKWLKAQKVPVYMRPEDLENCGIPAAVAFPKTAILRDFRPYLTNTISWLLALAVAMEFTEIHVYGVDMAQDGLVNAEYRAQRPSCEYFIGLAEGRGIKVVVPASSDLVKTSHLYGFENGSVWTEKLQARFQEVGQRKENAKGRLAQLDNERGQLIAHINQLDGAMQDTQYWLTNWSPQNNQEESDGRVTS